MCRHELRYVGIGYNPSVRARVVRFRCVKCKKPFTENLSDEDEHLLKKELAVTPEQRLNALFKLIARMHRLKGV